MAQRQAVIVSTARTPIAKAFRGSFNLTHGADMLGHAVEHAIKRAGISPAEVEDVIAGCGLPEGSTGNNVARVAAIRAGCPVTTSGTTINRFCSSGLQAVSVAAQRIVVDGVPVAVGCGVEQITQVQPNLNMNGYVNPTVHKIKPELYLPMGQTAEIVAQRYNVTRQSQDEYALLSQQRTAAAQESGRIGEEIAPIHVKMQVKDKKTGEESVVESDFKMDEGNRANTTLEGLSQLPPAFNPDGGTVTAGNSSQLSDGAAAVVLMSDAEAAKRNLKPLGAYHGLVVSGCEPDEMGIGPVFAVPKLLERFGLKLDDIDLIELNEAFASQTVYIRDRLGLDPQKLNVNGGAISIGHPYGMTGARQVGAILLELRRRKKKWGIVTMCIGGGMGAAGLFEAFPA
jgi:acetyl-CoA C-acetyltransferase